MMERTRCHGCKYDDLQNSMIVNMVKDKKPDLHIAGVMNRPIGGIKRHIRQLEKAGKI